MTGVSGTMLNSTTATKDEAADYDSTWRTHVLIMDKCENGKYLHNAKYLLSPSDRYVDRVLNCSISLGLIIVSENVMSKVNVTSSSPIDDDINKFENHSTVIISAVFNQSRFSIRL